MEIVEEEGRLLVCDTDVLNTFCQLLKLMAHGLNGRMFIRCRGDVNLS